jgi:hypothetical protein
MKNIKHILISITAVVSMIFILAPCDGRAQVVNASAKKRISIGVGMFTDFWMNTPDGMKTRTINQGVNVFGTYNMPFGKSNFSFAIGLGITVHNLYWNYMYQGDSASFQFAQIDTTNYKRSKLTLPYLEIPVEFRFKTKSKFAVAIGFKVGYMMYAHSKYVGDDSRFSPTNKVKYSVKGIKNIETFSYGPTLRVGYKWIHLNAAYSLSKIFQKGSGRPEMYPVSVGFVLLPF